MTFIKPTTLLVGALCLAETAAEENVKFNENFKSLYATPSLGHPHGLYTETAFTKVNNYEPFRDASECKKSCEDSIVKSAGTSATFGGYFVCEFKLKQLNNALDTIVACTKYSVEFTASTAGTGYPTFYDPRQMTAPALATGIVTTYDAWLYVIDTAQKGVISGPEDVQKGMVKAMACPTAPELIKKVTGDIYAELFKGFAMDKEDNDMLMPYQQKMKGEKDATLEQRLMAQQMEIAEKAQKLTQKGGKIENKMLVTGAKATSATTLEAAFKANVASCPDETAIKKVVTDNWPKPPADAAELRFAATLLASVAVLAPFA